MLWIFHKRAGERGQFLPHLIAFGLLSQDKRLGSNTPEPLIVLASLTTVTLLPCDGPVFLFTSLQGQLAHCLLMTF